MNDILTLSARELATRIACRELSAEAVTRACIEQIEASDPLIQAWQFFDRALALQQARQLDAQSLQGPLHGVPIGVKDLMDTTEFATFQPGPTCNPRAPANAPHTPGGSSSGSAAAVARFAATVRYQIAGAKP